MRRRSLVSIPTFGVGVRECGHTLQDGAMAFRVVYANDTLDDDEEWRLPQRGQPLGGGGCHEPSRL